MIYTFFSPFGNKLPKSLKMHSAMRLSGLVFGRWCRENSKDEGISGASGAGAGGGTEVVAGADEVALVSDTGTAADLCLLGTR